MTWLVAQGHLIRFCAARHFPNRKGQVTLPKHPVYQIEKMPFQACFALNTSST